GITEAALLPPTEEADGKLRRFVVAPRLATHVRHRSKYFDVPVSKAHEFVFTDHGTPVGNSAATLRDLAAAVERVDASILSDHSRHHDFSRWIATLFCDHSLANEVRQLEAALKNGGTVEAFHDSLRQAVEKRYDSNWPAIT